MVGVLVDHLRTASTALKRVVLVVYQDDAYRAFTETLNRMPGLK
jgi:O-acetyl-ADP-ribose deacetylase (regulator of RNase III)